MDCVGSWKILKNHENLTRFVFSLSTEDEIILRQIKNKLENLNFKVNFYLEHERGIINNRKYNKNLYRLNVYRKQDIIKLIKKLLPLSNHSEKIKKMKLILGNENKSWNEVKDNVLKLEEEIKNERIYKSS